jgi:hypothetical protein
MNSLDAGSHLTSWMTNPEEAEAQKKKIWRRKTLREAENTERKNMEILRELGKKKGKMDTVIVGGPTNSLVRHGKEGARGFGGERAVKVGRKVGGQEEWKVTYHLTDPVKINMVEKVELVERFMNMMQKVKGHCW